MKICHIANLLPGYHKVWGGGAQATYRVVELLEKKGVKNVVLALKPIKPVKEFEFYPISVMEDFLGNKARLLKRPLDIVAFFSTYKLLKKIRPDVVNLHNFSSLGFGTILAAKKLGIPIVFSMNDFWAVCPNQDLVKANGKNCKDFQGIWCLDCIADRRDFLQKISLRYRKKIFDLFLFSKIDKIIVLANYWKRLLCKYGVPKEKIDVIPLPLKKEGEKDKVKVKKKVEKDSILYVGWIVPKKGLHIAVKAMPYILKKIPDAKLYAIGNYNESYAQYKDAIESLIKKNKLEKNVFLLGGKPYSEVEKFIESSEIAVVPDQWCIALSTFLNEAMIHGKPVVASRIGGIPEYLHDKKDGLLVEYSNAKDFAKKIIYLLKNKKKAREFGKNAVESMAEKVNEEAVFKKLVKTYQDLISFKKQDWQ